MSIVIELVIAEIFPGREYFFSSVFEFDNVYPGMGKSHHSIKVDILLSPTIKWSCYDL